MKLKEAEKLVKSYGGALAKGTENGYFRRESWLPSSKDNIIKAFKLVISFLIEYKSWNEENYKKYVPALLCIDSFEEDKKVDRMMKINMMLKEKKIDFSLDTPEILELKNYMLNCVKSERIANEIEEFINSIYELDSEDPLFHQRVYTIIGLEYSPEKKKSFFDIFKFR